MLDYDLTSKQAAPSSHLSAKDLLPPMPDMTDLLDLEDARNDDGDDDEDAEQLSNRRYSISRSFRDVVLGDGHVDDGENSVDYKAFAKDLGASLDWDVQRGFLVIGSDDEVDEKTQKRDNQDEKVEGKRAKEREEGSNDAPTKLTLFVPAPDMTSEMIDAEDQFYDAPLASADAATTTNTRPSCSSSSSTPISLKGAKEDQGKLGSGSASASAAAAAVAREMTQAEATRAALQVLRNHRVAQEAAALATSRKLGKKPSPSQRVASPHLRNQRAFAQAKDDLRSNSKGERSSEAQDTNMDMEAEEEQDFSKEVMDTTADKIRGTDFYQLEFSLSGAKVRNVAELAKLLGVMRNKRDQSSS